MIANTYSERAREVEAWRTAALADGWTQEPTYPKHESIERAAILRREGFTASLVNRPPSDSFPPRGEASLVAWGPDGLAIRLPEVYDWDAIKRAVEVCQYCYQRGPTIRIGFAGRCCPDCHAAHVAEVEYRGWCD